MPTKLASHLRMKRIDSLIETARFISEWRDSHDKLHEAFAFIRHIMSEHSLRRITTSEFHRLLAILRFAYPDQPNQNGRSK